MAAEIEQAGGPPSEIIVIRTSGDRLTEAPLSQAGGKRLFVKEIEDALLRGDVDFAVHSAKDMPAELPDGLTIGAVPVREDPRDAVVMPSGTVGQPGSVPPDVSDLVALLGQAPRIGTSSVRRVAQLSRIFPEAVFEPIRGNLDTRLRKLDDGQYDVLVLAAAGLHRLGFAARISAVLPVSACVPAPGQGALALEVRTDDARAMREVARVDSARERARLSAERALVTALGGGCQVPIGALATAAAGGALHLEAIVTSLDGAIALRADGQGSTSDPVAIGARVAARLIADGAAEILDRIRNAQPPVPNP
jgi:hydroxymethylbilane synthase